MNLKLEAWNNIHVLSILGNLEAPQVPVLEQGLQKVLKSGKIPLLVDLTGMSGTSESVLRQIVDLGCAMTKKNEMVFCSTVKGVGHGATREEAAKAAGSPYASIILKERRLNAEVEELRTRKTNLEAKVKASASQGDDAKKIRKQHSELKGRLQTLEKAATYWFERRRKPTTEKLPGLDMNGIAQTFKPILEKQGLWK